MAGLLNEIPGKVDIELARFLMLYDHIKYLEKENERLNHDRIDEIQAANAIVVQAIFEIADAMYKNGMLNSGNNRLATISAMSQDNLMSPAGLIAKYASEKLPFTIHLGIDKENKLKVTLTKKP